MSVYGRRRRVLFGALAVLLAVPAFATGRHLLHGRAGTPTVPARGAGSAVRWPDQGQAALVLGNDRPAASPNQPRVPIASLAKVMTAYLVLKRHR